MLLYVQRKSNPDLEQLTSREAWVEFEATHLRGLLRFEKIPGEKQEAAAAKPCAEEDPWEQFNYTGNSEQQAVRIEDDVEDKELESL